jgi:P22_AR N-terminal domain
VLNEEQDLHPIEQQTLVFYGKPIVVVRLPDGQPGVVLRFLCENLQIDTAAQTQRIRRTEAIADDLVFALVETEGGSQRMAVLILHAVPFWLAGIDPRRVREEIRPEILRYQREVVDVLYAWAQSPKAVVAPPRLVPAEHIAKPQVPTDDANLDAWREYHRQMVLWIDWQHDIEAWRGSVESRLEGLEEVTNLIPEILERLGPQTLTPDHQRAVQKYVQQLQELSGKPYGMIYESLKAAFGVPRYADIPDQDWQRVVQWFQAQLEPRRKK